MKSVHDLPIAIVGIGGRFPSLSPGGVDYPGLWPIVEQGLSTCHEIDSTRWPGIPSDFSGNGSQDTVYHRRACLIPGSLPVSDHIPEGLDPLFHLADITASDLFDDLKGTTDRDKTGIIISNIALPTDATSELSKQKLFRSVTRDHLSFENTFSELNIRSASLPAALIAARNKLKLGAMTLDAACASALYTIHLSQNWLLHGKADAMVAGGLSRPSSLFTQMGFTQLKALSKSGVCRPFDSRADGLIVGEGGCLFLLKRLDSALRDGDHIHALVMSSALSNDTGGSLLAPDSEGQLRAMSKAYASAGWSPDQVDLIECHGTGTPTGDAVEFNSLCSLWENISSYTRPCIIGSIKSNIGHLLTAAGSAGLAKVLLAMKHKVLPPTAEFENIHPSMAKTASPFQVLKRSEPWNHRDSSTPRRAAVSGFGFGGINAHVLVEEWDENPQQDMYIERALNDGRRVFFSAAAFPEGDENLSIKAPEVKESSLSSSTADDKNQFDDDIAIVGMAIKTGEIDGLRQFQESWLKGLPSTSREIHELSVKIGHFKISPRELQDMLPQQLLMMLVSSEAVEDAQLDSSSNESTGVFMGIALDQSASDYYARWSALAYKNNDYDPFELADSMCTPLTSDRVTGSLGGMVASRITRELSAGGASFTISAGDHSGIRALETAISLLHSGDINQALVGAVDIMPDLDKPDPSGIMHGADFNTESTPLDVSSSGVAAGEGSVALVIKRLSDALRDGDRIYSTIKGIGISSSESDLLSKSLLNSEQNAIECYVNSLETALTESKTDINGISLYIANASGDTNSDAIEASALATYLSENIKGYSHDSLPSCALSSLKGLTGHNGAASGLTSVLAASLSLYQQVLPPSPKHKETFSVLNKFKNFLHIPQKPCWWFKNHHEGPRTAAIAVSSPDGLSSHVILQELDETSYDACSSEDRTCIESKLAVERRQPVGVNNCGLFLLKSQSVSNLNNELNKLDELIKNHPDWHAETLSRSWYQNNYTLKSNALEKTDFRMAITGSSTDELLEGIYKSQNWLLQNPDKPLTGALPGFRNLFYTPSPVVHSDSEAHPAKIAVVFPGSGNSYLKMGRDLSLIFPELLRDLEDCHKLLKTQFAPELYYPWRLNWPDGFETESHKILIENNNLLTFGHVSFSALHYQLLTYCGLKADAVLGYSLGESSSLFASGIWNDRDVMAKRMLASPLFQSELTGRCNAARRHWGLSENEEVNWHLALVNSSPYAVTEALKGLDRTYLLIKNTHNECVVGGQKDQLMELLKRLGSPYFELDGVHTVHCPIALETAKAYRQLHYHKVYPKEGLTIYSHAGAASYEPDPDKCADSILAQSLDTIDFSKLIQSAWDDGIRVFIEAGPRSSCSRMIPKILGKKPHIAVPLDINSQEPFTSLLMALGRLYSEGVQINLGSLYDQETCVPEHYISATQDLGRSRPSLKIKVHRKHGICKRKIVEKVVEEIKPALIEHSNNIQSDRNITMNPNDSSGSSMKKLFAQVNISQSSRNTANEEFNRLNSTLQASQARLMAMLSGQMTATEQTAKTNSPFQPQPAIHKTVAQNTVIEKSAIHKINAAKAILDREACMEFATGSISKVLGPAFASVDSHPTRVRLPDGPLMFVDRITALEGEKCSLGPGRVVTEHDIHQDSWYLDSDRIPTGVSVEAGQADLFLSAWLGIDLKTGGHSMYRLLDATVTFHDSLPGPGSTISYDIRINRFIRQANTYMFFFEFDGSLNGKPFITMRDGCAGFFTKEQLDTGRGLVLTEADTRKLPGKAPADKGIFMPFDGVECYRDDQLEALRNGDLAGCFGDKFASLSVQKPLTLPPPSSLLRLIDRVVELDPSGGRYGLGSIVAEKDIPPDAWFLTNHFVDDMVMPGTLMYESCMHALRVYLLRMGWIASSDEAVFEPIPEIRSQLRCRGQVIPGTRQASYRVEIKEIDFGPEPRCIAEAIMYADGRPVVQCLNMSIKLSGINRDKLLQTWKSAAPAKTSAAGTSSSTNYSSGEMSGGDAPLPAIYSKERILDYALGMPSRAFGDQYRIFDNDKFLARLPNPPYLFLDRITSVAGEPFTFKAGGGAQGQFDVLKNHWYFEANRQYFMPFSVLLEFPLQICGWHAAYIGSALTIDDELHFRNLDGNAILHEQITPHSGTLTGQVRLSSISSSGGMIIQKYDLSFSRQGRVIYEGDTVFGFFSDKALSQQIGIRGAVPYEPSPSEISRSIPVNINSVPISAKPYGLVMPGTDRQGRSYNMNDRITHFIPDGGPYGLGFIRAEKDVRPTEWFFKAHFYQDPVIPGSLGLEAFIQLLKTAAIYRWGKTHGRTHHFEPIATGRKHKWSYRGQVIPKDKVVTVDAVIKEINDQELLISGDGWLRVDGRIIYHMEDFAIRAVPIDSTVPIETAQNPLVQSAFASQWRNG